MRVPTYLQYKHQIEMISRHYDRITTLQAKIGSGKKIGVSSEDPVLALNIKNSKNYISHLETYQRNIVLAKNRTGIIESATTSAVNILARVNELIKSAQNDTLSNEDRVSIAKELEGLLSSLHSNVNTQDGSGNYVFGGINSQSSPFQKVNGKYVYKGSQQTSSVQTSPSITSIYNENGQHVFGDIYTGNGSFTINSPTTPNSGTAETSVGSISDHGSYVEDSYTLTFVTNSSGNTAIQVVGTTSGQVIPPPPATIPNDAPEYIPGDTINFNGISFEVKGEPAIGDQFIIAPSQKENVLNTLNDVISLLNTPISNDVEKAQFHQKLGFLSASIQVASDHVTRYLSEIGYRTMNIENAQQSNEGEMVLQKEILSKYEDADPYQMISELTQRMTSLQMTQQSYLKIKSFFDDILKATF